MDTNDMDTNQEPLLGTPDDGAAEDRGGTPDCCCGLIRKDHHDPEDVDWDRWLRCSWLEWLGQCSWLEGLGLDIRHGDIEKLRDLVKDGEKLTSFHVAGPALANIRMASILLWLSALVMPFIGYYFGKCPNHKLHEPFGHYRGWIVWPFFVVFLLYAMKKEFEAFKLVILPYCQMFVRPSEGHYFTAMGVRLTCSYYTAFIFGLSTISKLDLASNGLMLSKILITFHCDHCKESSTILGGVKGMYACKNGTFVDPLNDPFGIWDHVIDASGVRHFDFPHHLPMIMTVIWLTMFMQFGHLLLEAYPAGSVSHDYASESKGYFTRWQALLQRLGCGAQGFDKTWHADCLRVLSYNSRMISLNDKNLDWTLMRALELADKNRLCHAVSSVFKECKRSIKKIWFFTVFEKGLMLEIQVTIFAISHHILKTKEFGIDPLDQFDKQMVFSVMISFLSYFKAFYDHWDQLDKISTTLKTLKLRVEAEEDAEKKRKAEGDLFKACRYLWYFRGAYVVAVGILMHCLNKLTAAFLCTTSFYNIPVFAQNTTIWGCVKPGAFARGG